MKRTPLCKVVQNKYHCSVITFLEDQIAQGNGLKEIAEILD